MKYSKIIVLIIILGNSRSSPTCGISIISVATWFSTQNSVPYLKSYFFLKWIILLYVSDDTSLPVRYQKTMTFVLKNSVPLDVKPTSAVKLRSVTE